MKAVVYTQYGSPDVLHLTELKKPAPKKNEILVKVHATSVTIGDTRMRSFTVPRKEWLFARLYLGIIRPRRRVLGMELAGQVEAVGQQVTQFKQGDAIFASTFAANFGGYVEYKCLPENGVLALKPANMSYEEAATVPVGGMTAVRCLRQGNIQRGQKVLIYGASGSVGSYAVQLAKYYGAEVSAVCSQANLDLVQTLGADHVIDYRQEDFANHTERYDFVFDAVGKLSPALAKALLKPGGIYFNVLNSSSPEKTEDLVYLKELIEAGHIKAVIDKCYPFEAITEAHRYVEQGHKKGNVSIKIEHKK